jgi:hypothetical protein
MIKNKKYQKYARTERVLPNMLFLIFAVCYSRMVSYTFDGKFRGGGEVGRGGGVGCRYGIDWGAAETENTIIFLVLC